MIQRPSPVACKPFGAGPGELNTVSTLPTLRVRIRTGSKREAAIAVAAVAVNVSNSLRFMAAPLQAILYQAAQLHCQGEVRRRRWLGKTTELELRCSLLIFRDLPLGIRKTIGGTGRRQNRSCSTTTTLDARAAERQRSRPDQGWRVLLLRGRYSAHRR